MTNTQTFSRLHDIATSIDRNEEPRLGLTLADDREVAARVVDVSAAEEYVSCFNHGVIDLRVTFEEHSLEWNDDLPEQAHLVIKQVEHNTVSQAILSDTGVGSGDVFAEKIEAVTDCQVLAATA